MAEHRSHLKPHGLLDRYVSPHDPTAQARQRCRVDRGQTAGRHRNRIEDDRRCAGVHRRPGPAQPAQPHSTVGSPCTAALLLSGELVDGAPRGSSCAAGGQPRACRRYGPLQLSRARTVLEVLRLPTTCKLAHAFLWEYSCKRLKLAQLLVQLDVFLTWGTLCPCSWSTLCSAARGRRPPATCGGTILQQRHRICWWIWCKMDERSYEATVRLSPR
jgi:hypothetical protein